MIAAAFNAIVVFSILIGYPTAIMPIYRAPSTTDGLRLVVVCLVHPIVHELTMTVQRYQSGRSYLLEKTVNDPNRFHFPMAALGEASMLEAVFIMYRRMMIGESRAVCEHAGA